MFQKHCRKFKPVNVQWKKVLNQDAKGSCLENENFSVNFFVCTPSCFPMQTWKEIFRDLFLQGEYVIGFCHFPLVPYSLFLCITRLALKGLEWEASLQIWPISTWVRGKEKHSFTPSRQRLTMASILIKLQWMRLQHGMCNYVGMFCATQGMGNLSDSYRARGCAL